MQLSKISIFPCTYLRGIPMINITKVALDQLLRRANLLVLTVRSLDMRSWPRRTPIPLKQFVFRSLGFKRAKGYYLWPGTRLSYSRARQVLLAKLKALGLETSRFGLHSLRIGEASAAINNYFPDRVVKNHCRWKTDRAKDVYCREDINHQLLVSLNIGIQITIASVQFFLPLSFVS